MTATALPASDTTVIDLVQRNHGGAGSANAWLPLSVSAMAEGIGVTEGLRRQRVMFRQDGGAET